MIYCGTTPTSLLTATKMPAKRKARRSITSEGEYTTAPTQRKSERNKVEMSTKRTGLDSGTRLTALAPKTTRRMKKTNQSTMPKMPVEAICVGMKPTPKGKATDQKGVVLTLTGLYMSQSWPKVFGPEPKRVT